MFFARHLTGKRLADLCHRLSVQLEAGIDVRRIWEREADAAPGWLREPFATVRDAVAGGDALPLALAQTGALFPRLFLEMVQVGDETGMLGEVFRRLSHHYQHQFELQRTFRRSIAWPVIQFGIALFVVGVVIWILGIVADRNRGPAIDILGFGLIGTRGLIIYINFLIAAGLLMAGFIMAVRRGVLWTRPLQSLVIQLPLVGPCVEKICLSQLTWAMHLTLNVAMDLRRLLPLVLRAAGNEHYIQHGPQMVADVQRGMPLLMVFQNTGAFPEYFLDALRVGEESGQLVEAMRRLSKQYEEEAEAATNTLAVLAGVAVWVLVAMLIIFLIFRIFSFYVGAINDAVNM